MVTSFPCAKADLNHAQEANRNTIYWYKRDNEQISLSKHSLGFYYRAATEHKDHSTSPLFSKSLISVTFPHWHISYFPTGRHSLGALLPSQLEVVLEKWLKMTELPASRSQKPTEEDVVRSLLKGYGGPGIKHSIATMNVLCRNLSHMNLELLYFHMAPDWCISTSAIQEKDTVSPLPVHCQGIQKATLYKMVLEEMWLHWPLCHCHTPCLSTALPWAGLQHGWTSQVWHDASLRGVACGGHLLLLAGL